MIHNLYVIDSGVCIYSYYFKDQDIDDQLFSGFLSALGSFAHVKVFLDFLFISPLVFIVCLAVGYYGGLVCDRRKLFPARSRHRL